MRLRASIRECGIPIVGKRYKPIKNTSPKQVKELRIGSRIFFEVRESYGH